MEDLTIGGGALGGDVGDGEVGVEDCYVDGLGHDKVNALKGRNASLEGLLVR